jgi:SAM-dependent methyltransferase
MSETGYYQALDELKKMALAVNYNSWILDYIGPYIGKSVLEIGAGIGTYTLTLSERGTVYATDFAVNCIEELKNKFKGNDKIVIEGLDITKSPDKSLWAPRKIDTVICLNVIEHIEDDIGALRNMAATTARGAHIIIMVPAFQFAFGTIDILDGHFRRYSRQMMRSRFEAAGIKPVRIRYFNSAGLLAWYYTNKIVKNRETSIGKIKIYDNLFVPILKVCESIIPPSFGQSVIAIGRYE